MNLSVKKVLYIDLVKQTWETKSHQDLNEYIGGLGLALKLLQINERKDPLVFATGPLNGIFPYVCETATVFRTREGIKEAYLGGSFSSRMKFAGLDAIVILGNSRGKTSLLDIMDEEVTFRKREGVESLGLPGKKSTLEIEDQVLVDSSFEISDQDLVAKLKEKGLKGLVITGTKTFPIKNIEIFTDLFEKLIASSEKVVVEKGRNPACAGCPIGCVINKEKGFEGNPLIRSLAACSYADEIYSDANTAFACLNSLGYSYTHEDIENFPELVYDLLEELK